MFSKKVTSACLALTVIASNSAIVFPQVNQSINANAIEILQSQTGTAVINNKLIDGIKYNSYLNEDGSVNILIMTSKRIKVNNWVMDLGSFLYDADRETISVETDHKSFTWQERQSQSSYLDGAYNIFCDFSFNGDVGTSAILLNSDAKLATITITPNDGESIYGYSIGGVYYEVVNGELLIPDNSNESYEWAKPTLEQNSEQHNIVTTKEVFSNMTIGHHKDDNSTQLHEDTIGVKKVYNLYEDGTIDVDVYADSYFVYNTSKQKPMFHDFDDYIIYCSEKYFENTGTISSDFMSDCSLSVSHYYADREVTELNGTLLNTNSFSIDKGTLLTTVKGMLCGTDDGVYAIMLDENTILEYTMQDGRVVDVSEEIPKQNIVTIGDATGDGNCDIIDIITVNKSVLGKETIPEEYIQNIDSNKNGIPDTIDSLQMLKYVVGLIESEEFFNE